MVEHLLGLPQVICVTEAQSELLSQVKDTLKKSW